MWAPAFNPVIAGLCDSLFLKRVHIRTKQAASFATTKGALCVESSGAYEHRERLFRTLVKC